MYPLAVKAGMSKREFLHSTPNDVKVFIDAYYDKKEEEQKIIQYKAWLNGLYIRMAIGSAFNEQNEYPENPLLNEVQKQNDEKQKSEEETKQELLYYTLEVRAANARLSELDG